ncbi:MSMEG_1061 family FMN-dependent PPOX-type flavoprotein [Aquibacillus rhizosphaerae]|uniref:Pyridoxamine 5'-phosphate oxidase family protein n=1 Tax=Aquibacillus rhizosphaerae TaxID=3051431 RepID=A0ABT7L6E3_9BACI|nr:MSMEG_1061 family FMN-dependent PPOX-type flavoprotein [Aquibacillus sp. LR5S19]MDL4840979.1 pyridoxamine 5'-phosphate oxidase family protein [Aquibacillus sp. LR5S19]
MKRIDVGNHGFQSVQELREKVGTPHEAVVKKNVGIVDDKARYFIAQSPMVMIATSNEKGQCDTSPRGDHLGFVHVANQKQLVIPERPGNRRVDTLCNIMENPHVGLLFLIPGMKEVLRVNGQATVIYGHEVLEKLELNGKVPPLGILVEVEECFIHCPRALKFSGIWEPQSWPSKDSLPSAAEIFKAHLAINSSVSSK